MDVKASGTPKREVTKILTTSPILEETKLSSARII